MLVIAVDLVVERLADRFRLLAEAVMVMTRQHLVKVAVDILVMDRQEVTVPQVTSPEALTVLEPEVEVALELMVPLHVGQTEPLVVL